MSYSIDGHLRPGSISGRGTMRVGADAGAGELEVEFAERPLGWDPRTIVLMCCSRAVGMPAREDGGAASLLRISGGRTTIGIDLPNFPRRAALTDESGQLRAEVSAASRTDLADQQPYDCSTVIGGFSRMEPGDDGLAVVESVTGVMQQSGPRLVTVTTTYQVRTEQGELLTGTTFYPHYLPNPQAALAGPQAFSLDVEELTWDGRTMYARARACVAQLHAVFPTMAAV